jgi:chromate reductase, NAD(P)H dehydrogenase (quinone)
MKTIVSISGTSRPGNYTSYAVAIVNDQLRQAGVEVNAIDGRDLDLSFPGHDPTESSKALVKAVRESAAVVLATPEYHGSYSALTKLVIENLGFPSALKDKPVALLGVAGGRIGAIKSLEHLRGVCAHVGAIVLPGSLSVAGVRGAFDSSGASTDPKTEAALRGLADSLLEFLKDYVCPKHVLEAMVRSEEGPPWTAEV